ncbi:hypothetical protein FEM48_Zijuj01G0334400 [Ziziphus jujuba var. spinosa]|uniref:NOTCH1 EGF-like calcium-binding domain-containing protein n=1 Tax=Ziziphus jujuba var. spinosa TaxID=714518 RepID=A0A978W6T2_ZIZJJ|nr:hypothetical protein FEM48_Zijuj01G0334400 [Ziziphus jujuba var. spinosa]
MFTISNFKNKFTVMGCDSVASPYGNQNNDKYSTGCFTRCPNLDTMYARDRVQIVMPVEGTRLDTFANATIATLETPYMLHGCQDINECNSTSQVCGADEKCENKEGSYTCRPKDQLLLNRVTVEKHPCVNKEVMNMEEIEYLLAKTSNANDGSNTTSAYESIRNHVVLDYSGS